MLLIDHVSISVIKLSDCAKFYDAIMLALGCNKVYETHKSLGYGVRCTAGEENHSCLAIYESKNANIDDARHWCFKAGSRKAVDLFYENGINNGGRCGGAPGLREHYHANYYGAFLYDPFGNRIEAVFHGYIET
jgi:catechol 2,3-dioxygenase-like lactoylglutathione lyase family enzyme